MLPCRREHDFQKFTVFSFFLVFIENIDFPMFFNSFGLPGSSQDYPGLTRFGTLGPFGFDFGTQFGTLGPCWVHFGMQFETVGPFWDRFWKIWFIF